MVYFRNDKKVQFHLFSLSIPTDINVIKNQINSLIFVKKICETRIQRLQSGKVKVYGYSFPTSVLTNIFIDYVTIKMLIIIVIYNTQVSMQ